MYGEKLGHSRWILAKRRLLALDRNLKPACRKIAIQNQSFLRFHTEHLLCICHSEVTSVFRQFQVGKGPFIQPILTRIGYTFPIETFGLPTIFDFTPTGCGSFGTFVRKSELNISTI